MPEVVVPLTSRLGDSEVSVSALNKTFAQVADRDELTAYRSLMAIDRDVIRIGVEEIGDGCLKLHDDEELFQGARVYNVNHQPNRKLVTRQHKIANTTSQSKADVRKDHFVI